MIDPATIERLAKQSGLYISAELRIFAALIEAQMKERCAALLEANADACGEGGMMWHVLRGNAAAIRALT